MVILMKKVNQKFLYLILVFSLFGTIKADILMSPYLQALGTNSITIMVECDTKDNPKLQYGLTKELGSEVLAQNNLHTESSPVFYIHRIKLTNLESGKKYFYKVTHGKSQSQIYSFKTLKSDAKELKVAIFGDSRSNPKVFSKVAERIFNHNPDFVIATGDLVYNNKYKTWKEEFFTKSNSELIANYCYFNSPGNHEGWGNNSKAFHQNPESTSGSPDYYSLEFGDFYFLILNHEVSYQRDSDQWNFAKKDLARTKAKFKFVAAHKPAYGSGAHGEDKWAIEMTKEIFEPNKVTCAFAGHSHFYQRSFRNNVYHFVLGGAGAPLYNPGNAEYVQKSAKTYHYAVLEIKNDKLKMTIYDLDDNVIDTLELNK
jgi:predicted phosphodiesterase